MCYISSLEETCVRSLVVVATQPILISVLCFLRVRESTIIIIIIKIKIISKARAATEWIAIEKMKMTMMIPKKGVFNVLCDPHSLRISYKILISKIKPIFTNNFSFTSVFTFQSSFVIVITERRKQIFEDIISMKRARKKITNLLLLLLNIYFKFIFHNFMIDTNGKFLWKGPFFFWNPQQFI